MLVSTCCDAPIIQETESDDCGMCSKCFEYSEMWDDADESTQNETNR